MIQSDATDMYIDIRWMAQAGPLHLEEKDSSEWTQVKVHRDFRRAPEARPGHCGAERGARAAARRQRARQVGGRGGLHLDMFAKLEFKEFVCFPVTAAFALRAFWLHLHANVCRSLAHGPDERAMVRLWPLAEMLRALGRRALLGRLGALERVARRRRRRRRQRRRNDDDGDSDGEWLVSRE